MIYFTFRNSFFIFSYKVSRWRQLLQSAWSNLGPNSLSEDDSIWVVSMGHLMGLHDNPWLNIPPTRRMSFLRYCEFTQVSKEGKVIQQAMWFDIPHLMVQAGVNPFPHQTGAEMVRPGRLIEIMLWYTHESNYYFLK